MASLPIQNIKHLCIIAGNGKLPIIVVDELLKQKKQISILCFDEKNSTYFQNKKYKAIKISLYDVKNIVDELKKIKAHYVVCCGGVYFPGIKNIKLFTISNITMFIKYIIKVILSKQKGDNLLLSIAEQILKTLGYTIIPVQTILPNLLSKKEDEVLTSLSKQYKKDIELGVNILNHNSQFDIGQSIVIKNGRVVGIEGIEGTKELISRCGKYCKTTEQNKEKPVLVKASKLGQNMKLDVPTIGIDTIKDLINNNFAGIAIENNSVFMLEKDKIKELAKKNNIFIKII